MNSITNPFVVVLSRLNIPYQQFFCATRPMAERLEKVIRKSLAPGETVTVRENV